VDGTALVRRAIAGERGAFGRLYEAHVEGVHRFLWFRVGDAAVARDLTQDVFVSALQGLPRLDQPDRFGAWLLQIAHNRAANHWRSVSRRPVAAELDDVGQDAGRDAALAEDPRHDLDRGLDLRRLGEATRRLTADQQAVIALRFVAGLSLAETAEATDRSADAVKKLQRRALVALRQELERGEAAR